MNIAKLSVEELDRESITAYRSGRLSDAIVLCGMAIKRAPANDQYKMRYAYFLEGAKISGYDLDIKIALTSCLKSQKIEHQKMGATWGMLLAEAPAYPFLFDQTIDEQRYWKSIDTLLNDDFFLLGIQKLIMSNPAIEKALIRLRRTLLLATRDEGRLRSKHIPLLSALAIQCFYNEYVWQVDEEEQALLQSLNPDTPAQLALLGCYQALYTAPQAQQWLAQHAKGPLAAMVTVHLQRPLDEQTIKPTLPSFSPVDEKTSMAVQAMYEENPYPRWHNIDIPPTIYPDVSLDWLTAGCGTGRPIRLLSYLYPNARFTAIDLSRASMAYAVRQTREAGITNIDFRQGDILNVAALNKQFDFIESSGVLHHMKDPVAGWKALLACLRPGGRMQIGLYSKPAREIVFKVRAYIEEKGYKGDIQGIRQLRADMMALPTDHPLHEIIRRHDFYTASECRDLVFHVQEYNYTLPEIRQILDDLGLAFLGFKLRTPVRTLYQRRFPADTAMTDLDNWQALEKDYPGLFVGMYKFFCCRKDEIESPRPEWLVLEKTGVLFNG